MTYAPDIPGLRAAMRSAIDADAERCRLRYLTPGMGQSMVYQQKAAEADALLAAGGDPDPAAYPILAASLGIEADTITDIAHLVIGTRMAWTVIAAQIEAVRLGAKQALDQADDPLELRRIRNEAQWP
jgi:hypothetical protein